MSEEARFQLVLDVLTPTAVGSGEPPLVPELDYLVAESALLVYGPGLSAEERGDDGRILGQPPPAYRLPFGGTVPPGPVRPVLKDAFQQPYLPGSAIKGALHTAVAAALLARERAAGTTLQPGDIAPSARFAAQPLERRLFGAQPRASGFRALRVSDLRPLPGARLALAAVRTYTLAEGKPAPASERQAVEVIAPGSRFLGTLWIDQDLLARQDPRLAAAPNRTLIAEALLLARSEGQRLLANERQLFSGSGLARLEALLTELGARVEAAGEQATLLPIGWGAGWLSKSLGSALLESPLWPTVRERFFPRRAGGPGGRGRTAPGRAGRGQVALPFPVTRKLADQGGQPGSPLGWVLVRWVPAGDLVPPPPEPALAWQDDAFLAEREAVAVRPAAPVAEPASPFAALQALLQRPGAPTTVAEPTPPPPIPPVSDRALRPGTILEAEIVAVEPKRLLVNVGRAEPAVLEAATVGGGDLTTRFRIGQRLRVRVLTPPPFFRIRLA
jgi:CRISPR type III-A-associated RAMP protein Csm5